MGDGGTRSPDVTRWAILLLTLLGFAHVALGLGAKGLWWDESLSLQRAESALGPLLRGTLLMKDGFVEFATTDQHPFFSFLLQGIMIRAAGDSEFILRWPAAASATALVPALYVLGRMLTRRGVAPQGTGLWAALMGAVSPFFLWYGQEARPYALWALLTVLSTYLLLLALEQPGRAAAPDHGRRTFWLWAGYVAALLLMLFTHYYAAFLLPVHALIAYTSLASHNRRLALRLAIALLAAGAAVAALALWIVLSQGGGGNFASITLQVLLPDLINAFSLGLSVNVEQVRW
ncbi:MAG: glycosyltransferase family 39 protein, partial [Caldilineaceae bacterium]